MGNATGSFLGCFLLLALDFFRPESGDGVHPSSAIEWPKVLTEMSILPETWRAGSEEGRIAPQHPFLTRLLCPQIAGPEYNRKDSNENDIGPIT